MKIRQFLLCVVLTFTFGVCSGQFTISVIGSNDVCGISIPIQVDAPDPNFNYEWYVSSYDCFSSVISPLYYGQSGSQMIAYGTGEFFCYAIPVVGGPMMISNPVHVRVNLTSVGFQHLPRPYHTNLVACQSSVDLCVPTAFYSPFSATSIQWFHDNAPIPAATSASYTATQSGWYKYTITTSCMTDYSDSVQFISSSGGTLLFTGNPIVCAGTSTSICVTGSFVNYLWSTGQTTQCITVNVPGTYICTATDPTGCTVTGSASVSFIPALPVQISTTDTTLCLGQMVILDGFTVSGIVYLWSNGATTPSIQVVDTGTYSVWVYDVNGCSGTDSITLYPEPPYPTTIISGGPLNICLGDSVLLIGPSPPMGFYQWFRNNIPIPNAITQFYWAKSNGRYRCSTVDMLGCLGISNQLRVRVVCFPPQDPVDRIAQISQPGYTIFPNPASSELNVMLDEMPTSQIPQFSVYDCTGKRVKEGTLSELENNLDIRSLPAGIYAFRILNGTDEKIFKLVKY